MGTQITYNVSTDSQSYGSDCTVEQARTIANYIADKLYDYADQEGYHLTIEFAAQSGGASNPYEGDGSDEEAAYDDIMAYDETNWTDWAGEALNDQVV